MNDLTTADDSRLLTEWADARNQHAFTALVEKYQALVFGAALRRAGQPEVARDASQQVFTLVASRARLLVGHTNIAGWLYRASMQIAGQIQRSEARRRARQEDYQPSSTAAEKSDDRWLVLEQALDSLGGRDREALVLHYFQDLSYQEMAAALGIEQDTARQRVCRALERLGKKLRGHGYTGAVPALLASAVSWTASAGAALPTATAALAAGASPSLGLTFSAIMSHSACKIAAGILLVATLPWWWQWTAQAGIGRTPAPAPSLAAASDQAAPTDAEWHSFQKLRAARMQANWRAADLTRLAQNADAEILESLGTMEELARKAARTVLILMDADGPPPGQRTREEFERQAAQMRAGAEGLPQLLATTRNLERIERDSAKAGRFYATFVAELLQLDDDTRKKLDDHLRDWVFHLQQESLALPQRPREKSAEWDLRRMQATEAQIMKMFALLPAKVLEADSNLMKLSQSGLGMDREDSQMTMNFLFGARP